MQTIQLSTSELRQLKKAIQDAGQIDFEYFRGMMLVDSLLPEQVGIDLICRAIFGKANPLEDELLQRTAFPDLIDSYRSQCLETVMHLKFKLPPKTRIGEQTFQQIYSEDFPLYNLAKGVTDTLDQLRYKESETYGYSQDVFVFLCDYIRRVFACFSKEDYLKEYFNNVVKHFDSNLLNLPEQQVLHLLLQNHRRKLPENLRDLSQASFEEIYSPLLHEDGELRKRYEEAKIAFSKPNQSSQTRIEALDWLLRFQSYDGGISSRSMLDGYFTAILISPEIILPSQWLGRVTDSFAADPAFESLATYQNLMDTIMEEYNAAANDLIGLNEDWEPMTLVTPEDEIIFDPWCEGFMMGYNLRPQSWNKLPAFQQGYMDIIKTFGTLKGQRQLRNLDKDAVQKMSNLITPSVQRLIAESLELRGGPNSQMRAQQHNFLDSSFANAQPVIRTQPKVGRNDPCPCGSGKKYKKCCLLADQESGNLNSFDPTIAANDSHH